MSKYSQATKRVLVATLSLFAVTGGLVVGAGQAVAGPAAPAGTNGQHITLVSHHGDGIGSAQITGTNHLGERVTSPRIHLEHHGSEDKGNSDQWWKGDVVIDWFHWQTGQYMSSTQCTVPTDQGTRNNWVTCYGPFYR